jgi:hypothetical protein
MLALQPNYFGRVNNAIIPKITAPITQTVVRKPIARPVPITAPTCSAPESADVV